jgi:uridine kinase
MQEVTVTLPSGERELVPYGTRVGELFSSSGIVGALVNNECTSLSYKIEVNSDIVPVLLESDDGVRMYRNSLCFLLYMAARELFPDRSLVIGHSLGNGYFYYFDGLTETDGEDLRKLEDRMHELVEEKHPIQRKVISYTDALAYFKNAKQPDTLLLLEQQNKNKVPVYTIGNFMDLAHNPLVPNTSVLNEFEIKNYFQGFLLRYPPRETPKKLTSFKDSPILYSVYQEYKAWGKILRVHSVGRLNKIIYNREIGDFIQVAETLHNKKIAQIADQILEKRGRVKIVLIAGPSSSGKTTFTKKLAVQLRVVGFNPVVINMDNYFVPRHLNPVDENGNLDFEILEAIDVPLLNAHLLTLFDGGIAEIPEFDFKTGNRGTGGTKLRLDSRALILMEGIHGLNEDLTPDVSAEKKYKIYVSALTQLNLDDHNRISTTDNRLLRRMVRDHQFRGYSAGETLERWPSVRRGEKRNIFPYQDNADTAFNSALDYELSVLKIFAAPLLKTIKPQNPYYKEAERLLFFLDNFNPLQTTEVPRYSILREFIGESGFKY